MSDSRVSEWGDEDIERGVMALYSYKRDSDQPGSHAGQVRAVLEASEAVPKAIYDFDMEVMEGWRDRAESAEALCKSYRAALRELVKPMQAGSGYDAIYVVPDEIARQITERRQLARAALEGSVPADQEPE